MTATTVGTAGEYSAAAVRNRRRHVQPTRVLVHIVLWGYAALTLFPLVLMIYNSFRPTADLYVNPIGVAQHLTAHNFVEAWQVASFGRYFGNSLLVTLGSVALSTAVALPAAYALSRWQIFGGQLLEAFFIAGLMIPLMVTLLPVFYLLDSAGLIDSRLGLVLVYAANGVPFSIFVLSAFFRQLPRELDEAATVDGAGHFATFVRIMLPLVRPAIATVVIFRFVPIWNDFLYPLVLMRSEDRYTVPVGLTMFVGEYSSDWATLFAGLVIATVPLLVLFIVATRQIVDGLTAGIGK
jgi:raffinose/stachyose/melibiose transport system permease protein